MRGLSTDIMENAALCVSSSVRTYWFDSDESQERRSRRRFEVAVMSYVVKWKLSASGQTFKSRAIYAVPSNAIDFACTVF